LINSNAEKPKDKNLKEIAMSEKLEKYNFIVVKYPQPDTAEAALAVVRKLEKEKVVKLKDAVAITKTEKGKIKLHQTKDDPAGKGFLKGGLIGLIFAVLFGPAGWVVAGAALGTAFAMFDRGIKNKLLKELGEDMTPAESALAVLIEEADWDTLNARMDAKFTGEVIVSQMVEDHLDTAEELVEQEEVVETVPEELDLPESA
jgi:uncharacterized membrane protein